MQQYLSGENVVFSAKKDLSSEYEFLLPEYLPNISRIVKSAANIEKCIFRTDSGGSYIDVSLKICIIYVSDFGGKLKSAVFRETLVMPIAEGFEADDDTVTIPSAYVSSVSAKPVSARKITVYLSCHSSVTARKSISTPLLDSENRDGIHVLNKELDICKKATLDEHFSEYEADITVDSSKPSVGSIVSADAVFCSSSCKASASRLDFEAVFIIHALYETASDDDTQENTSYEVINEAVTVKDSIESEKISEGCMGVVYLDVCSVEPSVSFDPYGENRVVSFILKYNALPVIYEQSRLEIAVDAFAEGSQSTPVISDVNVDSISKTINNTVQISEPVRTDTRDISEVSDCMAKIMSVSLEQSDGKFFASAKCSLEILGTNLSGELCAADSTVNLHIPVSSGDIFAENAVPDVILSVKSCKAAIKEGGLIADFEIGISGVIVTRSVVHAVTALEIDSSESENHGKSEITVYYPQKDDTVWTVAKKYTVNPDSLISANAVENGSISSKHILLIP